MRKSIDLGLGKGLRLYAVKDWVESKLGIDGVRRRLAQPPQDLSPKLQAGRRGDIPPKSGPRSQKPSPCLTRLAGGVVSEPSTVSQPWLSRQMLTDPRLKYGRGDHPRHHIRNGCEAPSRSAAGAGGGVNAHPWRHRQPWSISRYGCLLLTTYAGLKYAVVDSVPMRECSAPYSRMLLT